jgi:hypothetical protein
LDIDIWYPAEVSEKDSAIEFREILGLLEKRAIYYTGSNEWKGITLQVAQSFCDGFKCSDTTSLLNYKTQSFRNAPGINKRFPLVIYICAYNGMSYENFSLFEVLAKNGFVVASISSIGRYPGDMTMKKEDMLEQVYDAIKSVEVLKHNSSFSISSIGIIGYSWGAMAGAVLAAKIPEATCMISLDGSEYHHYGESKEEDSDFNGILNSPEFKNQKISVPYLRLESSSSAVPVKKDSVYNFSEKLSGKITILEIDSAKHEDFSCLAQVVRESGNCTRIRSFSPASKPVLTFLLDNLKD